MDENLLNGISVLDIACGIAKHENAWGIDIVAFDGVDQVVDLNSYPWDLPSDHFTKIYAISIIEHVQSIPLFMNEIHRVAKIGAIVEIVTPHFTSVDSYTDPTHLWHLGCKWHEIIISSYLKKSVLQFEHMKTEISFYERNMFNRIVRFIIKSVGIDWWEKRLSFIFRGQDIKTILRVIKSDSKYEEKA